MSDPLPFVVYYTSVLISSSVTFSFLELLVKSEMQVNLSSIDRLQMHFLVSFN